jgi:hypothetical protein
MNKYHTEECNCDLCNQYLRGWVDGKKETKMFSKRFYDDIVSAMLQIESEEGDYEDMWNILKDQIKRLAKENRII